MLQIHTHDEISAEQKDIHVRPVRDVSEKVHLYIQLKLQKKTELNEQSKFGSIPKPNQLSTKILHKKTHNSVFPFNFILNFVHGFSFYLSINCESGHFIFTNAQYKGRRGSITISLWGNTKLFWSTTNPCSSYRYTIQVYGRL